jgi:hypothetical protein
VHLVTAFNSESLVYRGLLYHKLLSSRRGFDIFDRRRAYTAAVSYGILVPDLRLFLRVHTKCTHVSKATTICAIMRLGLLSSRGELLAITATDELWTQLATGGQVVDGVERTL